VKNNKKNHTKKQKKKQTNNEVKNQNIELRGKGRWNQCEAKKKVKRIIRIK